MRVSILGATGSVGQAALQVANNGADPCFQVVALTAGRNVKALARAARACHAEYAAIADPSLYLQLKSELSGTATECSAGLEAICEAASRDADKVVCAITGAAGLESVMAAIMAGRVIALANKEALVCAGSLMMRAVAEHGATLIPIDSEHNAIFQLLSCPEAVDKLILTASGGPFLRLPPEQMQEVTPEQACTHPNWQMGAKISVDSASMMNKAMELIEAVYLFGFDQSKIEILVHPQSIIHGMVVYQDGSVLAQMSNPDMRIPLAHALAWPRRLALSGVQRLDLAEIGRMEFLNPDPEQFPALDLARMALEHGLVGPAVLSTANEVAVEAFLNHKLAFVEIIPFVAQIFEHCIAGKHGKFSEPEGLPEVYALIERIKNLCLEQLACKVS